MANVFKKVGWAVGAGGLVAVAVIGWGRVDLSTLWPSPKLHHTPVNERLITMVTDRSDSVQLTNEDSLATLGLKVSQVSPSPSPEPLRLPGTLSVDPQRIVRVHSRFSGEIVTIGETDSHGAKRQLRYGDNVRKGDLLAVVWSKEIGEKKCELIDALSRLELSQGVLKRLESLQNGVVADRLIVEARRNVEADVIAASRAERTLRSWRVADSEIEAIRKEVIEIREKRIERDPTRDRKWAEIEIRSPIDGVVLEKNFNVGDMIEADEDLMKVADLNRLQVLVSIYEEDLWEIRALAPENRKWRLDLKSDPTDNNIEGTFELIGNVIDPAQRTGVLIGWLDNSEGKLAIGQFITATIQLPANLDTVAVPETAVIEDGEASSVFVETDARKRIFTQKKISVLRRIHGTVYVSCPRNSQGECLKAGDKVVSSGALSLGGELANLLALNPNRKTN